MISGLIYLASPYSKYPDGIDAAFRDVCVLAGRLLKLGYKVYSPIAHTHPIAANGGLDPLDHNIWLPFDGTMMAVCDAMMVAMMPSWKESYGIGEEIKVFNAARKPIYYINPSNMMISM